MYRLRKYGTVALLALMGTGSYAQRVSVKTNALYWATATPNIGAEFRLNRRMTLNVEALGNRLKVGSKFDSRVLAFSPELRYWFSLRPQAGHFVGLMAEAADYDVTLKNKVYKGETAGAGLTYGYSFVLSNRWSLEATAGLGVMGVRQMNHDKNVPQPTQPQTVWKVAPMRLGVSFVYIIK